MLRFFIYSFGLYFLLDHPSRTIRIRTCKIPSFYRISCNPASYTECNAQRCDNRFFISKSPFKLVVCVKLFCMNSILYIVKEYYISVNSILHLYGI